MEDSIRYAFRHGRCTVPAILVPQNEGLFCFVAAHSRYSELHLSIKISVMQAELQASTSDKTILHSQSTYFDKKILPIELEASPSVRNNLMVTMMSTEKQLERRLLKYGLWIRKCEDKLKILNHQKIEIDQVLFHLQGSVEGHILNHHSSSSTKEEIIKRIQSKVQSPAAILCGSNKEFSSQTNVMEEVVGLVALIGTVCTDKLSRILAEYLGEDQMLAAVCRSLKEVLSLEMYKENGEVDILHGLHAQAAALGKSIVGRFHVICLENISPYTGKIDESTPQRRLALPAPILPSQNIPPGFMGYAVNMVNLDDQHLQTRTVAGYGLRETLIYRLFGELQIYSTREHMIQAFACINHGAVSMDGGILRENGIISLGKWNPDICFPVMWPDAALHTSPEIMETVKHIEEKKAELERTVESINGLSELHKRCLNKFNKRKVEYTNLLNSMEPTLLEYKPHVKNSLEISPK